MSAPAERNGFGALRVFRGWAGGHHGAITPVGFGGRVPLEGESRQQGGRRFAGEPGSAGMCDKRDGMCDNCQATSKTGPPATFKTGPSRRVLRGCRRCSEGAAASRDAGREVRFVDAVVEQPVEDGFEARRRLFGIGRRPTLGFGEIGRSEKPGRECRALVREQIPARGIDPSHGISDSPVRLAEPLSIRRRDWPSPYQSAGTTDRAPINPPVRRTQLLSIRRCDGPSSYQSAGATGRAPINPPVRRTELLSIRRRDGPSPYQSAGTTDRAPINPPVRPGLSEIPCVEESESQSGKEDRR